VQEIENAERKNIGGKQILANTTKCLADIVHAAISEGLLFEKITIWYAIKAMKKR